MQQSVCILFQDVGRAEGRFLESSKLLYTTTSSTRQNLKGLLFTASVLIHIAILIRHTWLHETKIYISELQQGDGEFSG